MNGCDDYAEVIVSVKSREVDRVFNYAVPEALDGKISIGSRVLVPFGKSDKKTEAYVVGFTADPGVSAEKIKTILELLDEKRIFSDELLKLAAWMKRKYFSSMAECLRCIIPSGVITRADADIVKRAPTVFLNTDRADELESSSYSGLGRGRTVANLVNYKRIIAFLRENNGVTAALIKKALDISDSPLKTLEKHGAIRIELVESPRDPLNPALGGNSADAPVLSLYQHSAVEFILGKSDTKPVLIHGVTGSGKTEIYMRLINSYLQKGMQAIMLVPEISLTPQTVSVFYARFGRSVTVTHSRLSVGERYDQWKKARDGAVSIMIGPRSAVFTPFSRLGIIIIDEEHEHTYMSETSPKYSALEVALERSRNTGAILVLGSATPRLETYYKTREGSFDLITIDERINKRPPDVYIVDMRTELDLGNRSIFSRALSDAVLENLGKNEQTILFLNRRGHSTFISCRKCGYVMTCRNCSVNYTYHIYSNKLVCHYCGESLNSPENCPSCGSRYIKYFGVGTQKLEEEAIKHFPSARILRMDMDTTSGKHGHERILNKFSNNEADILIGTQMIAKGLDFPNVTLVGVIAADLSINNGDYRSGETTFQLLTQVSGRAGRAEAHGSVYIQTYNPEHYSIVYARENNYPEFYRHEIALRRQMMYPPFTEIFLVLFAGTNEKDLIVKLYKLLDIMKLYNREGRFGILGPAPAVVTKIKNVFRWKLYIKCGDEENLKNFVLYCVNKLKKDTDLKDISIQLTLNPISMA